ncbi:MAG: IPT/TIG domain-containing protein, partial [Thermoanaerobaculia bacterium]
FYDRRLDPANSLIDRFGAIATISGSTVTLLPNFRITSGSFPVAIGQDPAVAADYMGDYDMAAADSSFFYTAWGDNRNGDGAHANEPDVFFAEIPVAGPGVILEAAGSSLVSESCLPGNGAIDPGETVTVSFTLRNTGSAPTANLVATLEATGGVISPSGPQSYGAIPPSGGSVSRPFTFVAAGACAGTLTATLDLQDGDANLGTLAFMFPLGAPTVTTFANSATITINDIAAATPYPSALVVSGVTGPVTKVTVTVSGFSHTFPSDVDILLAGPTGQTVMLMANVGNSPANATLTFDDAAASAVTEPVVSGTYKPTRLPDSNSPCGADDDTWAAPAPPPPYGSVLSGFNGLDPNGTWSLFVRDDCAGDTGSIAGGWSLTLFGSIVCCASVSVSSVTPGSGPAAGGTTLVINGTNFVAGASVTVAGVPATAVSVASSTQIDATTGPGPAGTLGDVIVANPDGGSGSLPNAFVYDFLDVPDSHPFHDFIVAIFRGGITAGCGGGNYCPENPVTRAQMAVFLLKAEHGSAYMPPSASGTVFGDVGVGDFAADWIEQLYSEGITGGCSASPLLYCPNDAVTRAQMAVFLLRAEHGSGYLPPACAGIFQDVECTPAPAFAVDWIERLYAEGVTGGCGSSPLLYCPDDPNTRGQMAVFLTETFNLP